MLQKGAGIRCDLPTILCIVLVVLSGPSVAAGRASHNVDPETTLESWRWQDESVFLELVQRLPDQTRAFFLARGFDTEAAEEVAQACVFQAEVRNTAPAESGIAVQVQLTDWRVESGGVQSAPQVRDVWEPLWAQKGASEAARIAFRWSLFPTKQAFLPGDYNWGMIAFGPRPGVSFTLHASWNSGGEQRVAVLRDIVCAPDRSVGE